MAIFVLFIQTFNGNIALTFSDRIEGNITFGISNDETYDYFILSVEYLGCALEWVNLKFSFQKYTNV